MKDEGVKTYLDELFIEFYGWKRELFRTAISVKGLRVENWTDFEEKREREDGLRNELNGEDIVKSKEERKELGVKTRTDDRQTRRTRKRVR